MLKTNKTTLPIVSCRLLESKLKLIPNTFKSKKIRNPSNLQENLLNIKIQYASHFQQLNNLKIQRKLMIKM